MIIRWGGMGWWEIIQDNTESKGQNSLRMLNPEPVSALGIWAISVKVMAP